MRLNLSNEWYRKRSALPDKVEVSAGTIGALGSPARKVVERDEVERELATLAFGRLVNLYRRSKGLRIEELADQARIDPAELITIEEDLHYVPEVRTVYQLSKTLSLRNDKMMELSGNMKARDQALEHAAVRFAARSESVERLTSEEQKALEEFVKYLSEQ